MDREAIEYFFIALDSCLSRGQEPEAALLQAVKDYAYVFYGDSRDGRTPFNRAAEIELERLTEDEVQDE